MSIRAIEHVWQHSKMRGTHLLMMLAIANYAQDNMAGAFPSYATLAKRCRVSRRTAMRVAAECATAGEIRIRHNGPNGSNFYDITVSAGVRNDTPLVTQLCHPPSDTAMSPNPSVSVNEPKSAANAAPIIADIPATADVANSTDMSSPKRDALEDIFFRATKVKTHRDTINAWRGAEHLKDVCAALCDATGLPVQKGDAGKWLKGAVALHELGATQAIIKRVWDEATERDRQFLTHPQAFTERVRGVIAKQRSQPAQDIADSVPVMLENGDIEYRRVTK
jgi:hypothetical protein